MDAVILAVDCVNVSGREDELSENFGGTYNGLWEGELFIYL